MPSANGGSAAPPTSASALRRCLVHAAWTLPLLIGGILVAMGFVGLVWVILWFGRQWVGVILRAVQEQGYQPQLNVGLLVVLLPVALICFSFFAEGLAVPVGLALVLSLLVGLLPGLLQPERTDYLAQWALTFAGACAVGWPLSALIALRLQGPPMEGLAWVWFVLVILWLQDAAHRLAGWRGRLAGLVAAVAGALLVVVVFGLPIGYGMAALLGLAGGLARWPGERIARLLGPQFPEEGFCSLPLLFAAPVVYHLSHLLRLFGAG